MKVRNESIDASEQLKSGDSILVNLLSTLKSLSHKYIAVIIFLALWEIFPIIGVFNPLFIPPPSTILTTMWELTLNGILPMATFYTFSRVLAGIGFAILIAIPLGFLLGGFFKSFEKATNPLLRIIEQGNPLTLFHLFVLLVGLTELSTVIVVYWAAQWPILNSTVTGARNVDPVLIKAGKAAGLDRFDLFLKIQLPAALPTVFTGMRLGVIFAFLILMGVEMMGMGGGVGLGYFIMQTQMTELNTWMWAGIVTMSLLCIIINLGLIKVEKRLTRWKDDVSHQVA